MKKVSNSILLDVNVLLALGWATHPFHSLVVERMERHTGPWLTCTVTQLGFIRLSANPAVTKSVVTARQAAHLLVRMTADAHHCFIPDVAPLQDSGTMGAFDRVLGSQQVTDAYLLAMAHRNDAAFLTLDQRLTDLAASVGEIEVLRLT